MTGEEYLDTNGSRIGGIGGIFMCVNHDSRIGFKGELLYTQKGSTKKRIDTGLDYDVTYEWDYIEIPLLIVLSTPINKRVVLEGFGGVALTFNVGARVKGIIGGKYAEIDLTPFRKSTSMGGVLGLGVAIGTGPITTVADVRWTIGSDIEYKSRSDKSRCVNASGFWTCDNKPEVDYIAISVFSIMVGAAIPL
jgi:hypothetical protein